MSYRPYTSLKTSGVEINYSNNSGVTIVKGTPVCQKSSGNIGFVNVSVESDAFSFIGIASFNILNNTVGPVVTSGRVENVIVTGSFGDALYVSKTGDLTITKPEIGVGGFLALDFILKVGVIAKNSNNPILKDIILDVQLVGQL